MATNKNKAEEVLREAYDLPHMAPVEMCENMVNALEAAGLLAPDLPKSEDEWESEYPGVMHVRFGRAVSTCTPSRKPAVYLHGMVYETQIARQIALDILAACEYAEEEQDNE